jgi:transcriptional regulator with XRE-family HTH domain
VTTTGDVIRRHRSRLGLSQAALGERIGESQRQIARWEAGESEPSLSAGLVLAEALGVSAAELGGALPRGLDLSGTWWAAWQTWKDEIERVDVHPLAVRQDGDYLEVEGERARPVAEGSYSWTGEMRLWDNETLMGWYIATEGAVRSKGSLYFALHPHGETMVGSWTGLSHAGLIVRGWGAIARDRTQTEQLIGTAIETKGHLTAWPTKS